MNKNFSKKYPLKRYKNMNKINLSFVEGEHTEKIKQILPVKLTKKTLNDFIGWTTSRYNDYLGFGTKREAVLTAYHSILKGYCVNVYVYKRGQRKGEIELREKPEIKIVELKCASPVGENGNYNKGFKAWATKQAGDEYTIDCENMTITAKYSNRTIIFLK